MKIAVLAIALNEENFVERWFDSAAGADHVILVDTGSSDNTAEIAKTLGATTHSISVSPWRFDVARNTALALVPADVDVVVNLDLDEILMPGWRQGVEQLFTWDGATEYPTTRLHYDYIWSFSPDGTPGVRFYRDMIHTRHGYIWKHPCHESLYYVGEGKEQVATTDLVKVEHHPDQTKSRGQYLDLLKLGVEEASTNDRISHYYARELFYRSEWQKCIVEFERHLSLASAKWAPERAQSMIYLSRAHEQLEQHTDAYNWAIKSVQEDENRREPFMRAAHMCYVYRKWLDCLFYVEKALSIDVPQKYYMNDPVAFSGYLYDIGFLAAFNLGRYELAEQMIDKALEFNPNDARLISNREHLREKWPLKSHSNP